MANVSFGKPGQARKTFKDKKFELQGGNWFRNPCPLVAGFDLANFLKDGMFLAPAAGGKFDVAADADRSAYMIFTANSEVIIQQPTSADDFPGRELSDTPTGLGGPILGIWPIELLHTGARGTATVNLASYAVNTKLTIVNGRLCPANVGGISTDKVVGYVEADSSSTGTNSVQCRLNLS